MIVLQTCPSCGANSSSSAQQCSRCGRSFRSRRSFYLVYLIVFLLAGGLGAYWYTGGHVPGTTRQTAAVDGFGALSAESDTPLRQNMEAITRDFRIPMATVRTVAWSWTSAIRRNHPGHERAAIVSAVVASVQAHGVRGTLPNYFEEYWALAERGLDSKQIQQALRAQMFRGK